MAVIKQRETLGEEVVNDKEIERTRTFGLTFGSYLIVLVVALSLAAIAAMTIL